MGIWLAFLIPVFTLIAALIFFGRRIKWWEPLLLGAISFAVSGICAVTSENSQTRATEFLGGWVTSAEHVEPWNEWVEKTCTRCVRTDTAGRCVEEESYDCSYCSEHSDSYDYETTVGSGFFNSEEVWNNASVVFGKQFVDLNRHSECSWPKNGNKWVATWNGDSAKMIPFFKKHGYENRVQAVPTLFSFETVDPVKTKVFEYPKADGLDNTSILTEANLVNQSKGNDLLNYYNGRYGANKQCHAYLVVFKNRGPEAGRSQEAYWKGGGKNELVTTVGIDNSGTIQWAYVFSWSKEKMPNIVIRDSLMRMKTFDAYKVVELIGQEGVKKFKRREFKEFAYISIQPSNTAIAIAYIIVILLSIGWVIFKKVEMDAEGTETGLFFDRLNPAHRIVRNRNRKAPWE
jgi:hypothetical protein